jgi:hypothetical protein
MSIARIAHLALALITVAISGWFCYRAWFKPLIIVIPTNLPEDPLDSHSTAEFTVRQTTIFKWLWRLTMTAFFAAAIYLLLEAFQLVPMLSGIPSAF